MRRTVALCAATITMNACSAEEEAPMWSDRDQAAEQMQGATQLIEEEASSSPQPQSLDALGPFYASANLSNGRRLFDRCATCHTLNGSRAPLPGPTLQDILGQQVGSQAGYAYSDALDNAEFVWTAERMDAWLASPDNFLEGNTMSFAGVSDPNDRRDLIACISLGQTCIENSP